MGALKKAVEHLVHGGINPTNFFDKGFDQKIAQSVTDPDLFGILGKQYNETARQVIPIVASFFGPIGAAAGAAYTAANNFGQTGKVLPSLEKGGISYLGSQLGGKIFGDLGTVGGSLGDTASNSIGSVSGNNLGSFLGDNAGNAAGSAAGDNIGTFVGDSVGNSLGDAASSSIGSAAGSATGTTAGNSVGNFIGNQFGSGIGNAAGTAVSSISQLPVSGILGGLTANSIGNSLTAGAAADPSIGTSSFTPSQSPASALPGSLSSLSGLDPNQQASNIATKGVYGGGNGSDEQSYFLNLVNRQLVDPSIHDSESHVNSLSSLSPIENSYLGNLGLGGYGNSNDLLQAISKWTTPH